MQIHVCLYKREEEKYFCGNSRFSHEIFKPPFHLFLPLSSLELRDMLYLWHLSAKKGAKVQ